MIPKEKIEKGTKHRRKKEIYHPFLIVIKKLGNLLTVQKKKLSVLNIEFLFLPTVPPPRVYCKRAEPHLVVEFLKW